jgi:hypothetical protein
MNLPGFTAELSISRVAYGASQGFRRLTADSLPASAIYPSIDVPFPPPRPTIDRCPGGPAACADRVEARCGMTNYRCRIAGYERCLENCYHLLPLGIR